jgi:hypothetical protein
VDKSLRLWPFSKVRDLFDLLNFAQQHLHALRKLAAIIWRHNPAFAEPIRQAMQRAQCLGVDLIAAARKEVQIVSLDLGRRHYQIIRSLRAKFWPNRAQGWSVGAIRQKDKSNLVRLKRVPIIKCFDQSRWKSCQQLSSRPLCR